MSFVDEIAYDPYELNVDYSILKNTFPKVTSLLLDQTRKD